MRGDFLLGLLEKYMHMYIPNHNLVVSLAILTIPLFFSVVQENISCLGWSASTFLEGWDCSFWDGSSMSQLETMMRAATHRPHRCRSSQQRCELQHTVHILKTVLWSTSQTCTKNYFCWLVIASRIRSPALRDSMSFSKYVLILTTQQFGSFRCHR